MKKYLLALVLILPTFAHADRYFSNSDALLGTFSDIKCGAGLSCAKVSGKLQMTGGAAVANQIASSTTSLVASQCGSTVISDSADVITLPEASSVLGCRFTFVCGTADDFDINPADASDQIRTFNYAAATATANLAPSAGDAVRCTDIGSSLTMEAVGANAWNVIGVANGPWSDVN